MEPDGQRRLQWIALTLPLPLAALAVYTLSEWLFFVTKPSVLSTLSWPERLTVLVTTPAPFFPWLLGIQLVATLVAMFVRPLRALAVVPAGILLGCLGLILIDNFTHVLFGKSSANADIRFRYVYVLLLLILIAMASRALYVRLSGGSDRSRRAKAAAIALLALPSVVAFLAAQIPTTRGEGLFSLAAAAPGDRRLNVLFLTHDGVEARDLSVYGSAERTTPFLASIRDETLFCENAFANACRTYGSLVTILTGKLPTTTRVLDPPSMLYGDARYEHLPGILRRHGYRTLQVSMKHHADAVDANLVGAFDLANYDWEELRLPGVQSASDTARVFRLRMFGRLEERLRRIVTGEDRDTFAFVMETHRPDYWRDARRIETLLWFMSETAEPWFAHVHLLDTHLDVRDKRRNPLPSIRAADDSMRAVFDALRRSGQLDRTIVVIASDHGRLWQTRERIPLMIRFPHGRYARREIANAQTADIAPTTLDALGLPIPEWMDGRSLLQPLPEDRTIVTLCGEGFPTPERLGRPNWGTETAMIVAGSWWYELQLADGTLRVAPVNGHTAPTPQAPPGSVVSELARKLTAAGFRLSHSRAGV